MFSSIKWPFVFCYETDLAVSDCKERLTFEYQKFLRKEGKTKSGAFRWSHEFYTDSKGRLRAGVDWGMMSFYFTLHLAERSCGTLIKIVHIPFNFSGLFFPALLSFSGFVAALLSLFSGRFADSMSLMILALCALLICTMFVYFGRQPIRNYLINFLDCRPLEK